MNTRVIVSRARNAAFDSGKQFSRPIDRLPDSRKWISRPRNGFFSLKESFSRARNAFPSPEIGFLAREATPSRNYGYLFAFNIILVNNRFSKFKIEFID